MLMFTRIGKSCQKNGLPAGNHTFQTCVCDLTLNGKLAASRKTTSQN